MTKKSKIINRKYLTLPENKLSSIRQAFGEAVYNLARTNKNIYVVNADLKTPLFLNKFASKYPNRFIECGVAEANAAGVAAGLAASGKTVFLTSFACFSPAINWAVIKQSICYNRHKVIIVGSHAGLLSGDLGATHQMLEDVALMQSIPTMEVFAPLDANECHKIVQSIVYSPNPSYLRLVRPATPLAFPNHLSFAVGKSQLLRTGTDITVLGYGPLLANFVQHIKKNDDEELSDISHSVEIINVSSIKPLDTKTIIKSLKKTGRCLIIEDHQKNGGLGQAVAALLLESGLSPKFIHLAVDDQFGQSSHDPWQLYDHYHLGLKDIKSAIRKLMK